MDARVENTPSFLSDWTKTELTAQSSNDVTFVIYQKDFSKGDTITLGSNGQSAYCVNYTVFLTEQASEQPTSEPEPITTPTEDPSPTVHYGDADCDGKVDVMDVILLNKALFGKASLSEQGILNVDVDQDNNPTFTDSLNIMRMIVKLISESDFPLK